MVNFDIPNEIDMTKPRTPLLSICGTCSKNFECYFPTTATCPDCETC